MSASSEVSENQTPRTVADAPFGDSSQADLVIRTSDGVDFYVYKFLLSLVSPVFKDMFSLAEPQPRTENDQIPFIDVSETAEVIRNLLRFIDPRLPDCETLSLVQASELIFAADKYQMDCLEARIVSQLKLFTTSMPFPVYKVAVSMAAHHQWAKDLAHDTAKQMLSSTISSVLERNTFENHLSAHVLRLTRFHVICGDIAKAAVSNLSWLADLNPSIYRKYPQHCYCVGAKESAPVVSFMGSSKSYFAENITVPHWIDDYRTLLADRLVLEPLGNFLTTEVKQFIAGAKNRPCMKAMALTKDGFVWIENFNAALVTKIEDSISKVDLGFEDNCMPFIKRG